MTSVAMVGCQKAPILQRKTLRSKMKKQNSKNGVRRKQRYSHTDLTVN